MGEKRLVIFIDSGDTIIDEGTEIRNECGIVIKADVIPGADTAVRTLHERGYTLALVADGLRQSFQNMYTQHGLIDCFSALIYSEDIGVCKPDERMFRAAMDALGLQSSDLHRIIMVGNNLARDIKGANAFGITSVLMNWTTRYPKTPADESEKPDYIINEPMELLSLAEMLEAELSAR